MDLRVSEVSNPNELWTHCSIPSKSMLEKFPLLLILFRGLEPMNCFVLLSGSRRNEISLSVFGQQIELSQSLLVSKVSQMSLLVLALSLELMLFLIQSRSLFWVSRASISSKATLRVLEAWSSRSLLQSSSLRGCGVLLSLRVPQTETKPSKVSLNSMSNRISKLKLQRLKWELIWKIHLLVFPGLYNSLQLGQGIQLYQKMQIVSLWLSQSRRQLCPSLFGLQVRMTEKRGRRVQVRSQFD